MEILLITLSFLVAGIIIANWRGRALLAFLYLITIGTSLHFAAENEKVWEVTVKGETFKAKNIFKQNGLIRGIRISDGREFVMSGEIK